MSLHPGHIHLYCTKWAAYLEAGNTNHRDTNPRVYTHAYSRQPCTNSGPPTFVWHCKFAPVSSSSADRASDLKLGRSWARISSGTRKFFVLNLFKVLSVTRLRLCKPFKKVHTFSRTLWTDIRFFFFFLSLTEVGGLGSKTRTRYCSSTTGRFAQICLVLFCLMWWLIPMNNNPFNLSIR